MGIIFTLFVLSFMILVGLVAYQAYLMRRGKISALAFDPEIENPLSRTNITTYKNTIYAWLEARTRKVVLHTLKFTIKLGYFVKNKLDAIVSRVHRKAASHERKIRQEEDQDTDKE